MAKGMLAGGKLHEHRKRQKWNDKNYNKANGISRWKTPFEMASHASGIVLKRVTVEAKQPNSACRKCVKVQLKKNNKSIVAFVPGDGNIEFIDEFLSAAQELDIEQKKDIRVLTIREHEQGMQIRNIDADYQTGTADIARCAVIPPREDRTWRRRYHGCSTKITDHERERTKTKNRAIRQA